MLFGLHHHHFFLDSLSFLFSRKRQHFFSGVVAGFLRLRLFMLIAALLTESSSFYWTIYLIIPLEFQFLLGVCLVMLSVSLTSHQFNRQFLQISVKKIGSGSERSAKKRTLCSIVRKMPNQNFVGTVGCLKITNFISGFITCLGISIYGIGVLVFTKFRRISSPSNNPPPR